MLKDILRNALIGFFRFTGAIRTAILGMRGKGTPVIAQQELVRQIESNRAPLILDVRSPEEFEEEHLPGAVNIPHTELPQRLAELEAVRRKPIVVH